MMRPGATGKVMQQLTGLDAKADQERFLVAYPDGLDGAWNSILCCNDTDDVGFIRALVDHAKRRWRADPDRVYATGASAGAAMSYRLAAALPGLFAAIAPVSGALADLDVPEGFPRTPVSLVAFHGRRDTIYDAMDEQAKQAKAAAKRKPRRRRFLTADRTRGRASPGRNAPPRTRPARPRQEARIPR